MGQHRQFTTLFAKILFTDYDERFTVIEFIGEWNDTLFNDVMNLKRNVIETLQGKRALGASF